LSFIFARLAQYEYSNCDDYEVDEGPAKSPSRNFIGPTWKTQQNLKKQY
jgi:hypothetical protein